MTAINTKLYVLYTQYLYEDSFAFVVVNRIFNNPLGFFLTHTRKNVAVFIRIMLKTASRRSLVFFVLLPVKAHKFANDFLLVKQPHSALCPNSAK